MAFLELNDPDRLNVLTRQGLSCLEDCLERVEAAGSEVRALIVHAAGERAFCAGADVGDWSGYEAVEFGRDWIRTGHRVFARLAQLPQPVIGAVEGVAYGGGLELLAACDIRIAGRAARFAMPEARVGIVPGWSGTQRLARQLPHAVFRQMLFTGRPINAEHAYRIGFVGALAETGTALAAARETADEIAKTGPVAVEVCKQMVNAAVGEGSESAIEALAGSFVATTGDKAEGVASFKEKRVPNFVGR
ncbi:enoyl-CoA hydratase/isomerase family protein [Rhodovibrio salinarum]|nr:enoyl-CoA hydratase-related protein [Rhodovibrio salinarum]